VALAVVIERLLRLYGARIDEARFTKQLKTMIEDDNILAGVELCENTPGPVARVCKMGLLKHDRSKAEMKEAIEDAAVHEIPLLEKRLPVLATIAHISPLLGLLGTVLGMIKAFHKIQRLTELSRPVDAGQLAEGIWEALITTAFGLLVAIPTFVAYNYLVSRVDGIVSDMERTATDMVNLLEEKRERSGV
jgi:biopolymer transport protein ExbB